jgi:hypothetical protein
MDIINFGKWAKCVIEYKIFGWVFGVVLLRRYDDNGRTNLAKIKVGLRSDRIGG